MNKNNSNLYTVDVRNLHINPLNDIEDMSDKMSNIEEKAKYGQMLDEDMEEMDAFDQILIHATHLNLTDYYDQDEINEWDDEEIEQTKIELIENEWSDGSKVLYRIDLDSNLYQYLLDWYGRPQLSEKQIQINMQKYIRGYYIVDNQYDHGLYFMTGIGYDGIDKDLLGGNGDGRTKEFFNNYFVYGQHQVDHPGAKTRNKWMQLASK